jgi:hypothetical protein
MTRTVIGDLTLEALREFGERWPSKSIARYLLEKNPLVFKDINTARDSVRYYRGNKGDRLRTVKGSDTTFRRKNGAVTDASIPLPKGYRIGEPWNIVPVTFDKALLLQDIHLPFHDPISLSQAIARGRHIGVDCVIINGDLADFYGVSKFDKNPESHKLVDEVEMCRLFLEHLRDQFPKAQIFLKEGNHEERLWRYCFIRCPELWELKDKDGKRMLGLANLLDAESYGVTVVADKRPIRAGKHLHILHGHEFRSPFQNPVNPARGLYLRAKCNAVCGDLHQSSNHTETGLTNTVSCWSAGCLCDLHPQYMPLNKWNLGFGIINLFGDQWSFENFKIISGTVVSA